MTDQLQPMTEAEREWHRKRAYEANIVVENAKENAKEGTKEREPTEAERKQYAAYLAAGGPAGEPESLDRAGIGHVEAQSAAARTKAEKQAEKDEAEAEERERQRQAQAQAHHR